MAKEEKAERRRRKQERDEAREREWTAPAAPDAPVEVVTAEPAAPAPVTVPVIPPVPEGGPPGLRRLADRLGGATLCYGEPVRAGERVVVPVARVRGAGGYGFGRGTGADGDGEGDGGGGGGTLEATPAGYLDITPHGVRYEAIPDPMTTARAISTVLSAATLVIGTALGVRRRMVARRPG